MIKEALYKVIQIPAKIKLALENKIQIQRNLKIKEKEIKPKIILAITPIHGNMGDQFIAVAEQFWLNDFFPDYKVVEFSQQELEEDSKLKLFKSVVKPNDIIFFHGGGNINDIYFKAEAIRRKIIESYPENTIISFQQSIHFGNSDSSQKIKLKTSEIYNEHKNLYILTREETSFNIAKGMFLPDRVFLYPDMATYMLTKDINSSGEKKPQKIKSVALCFRNDQEKFYSNDELQETVSFLIDNYECEYIDTHIVHRVYKNERYREVKDLIDKFSKYDLIITDRFHGAIFSVFAGTPCIALKSTDHKIESGVKWFNQYNMVKYADSTDQIPKIIQDFENCPKFDHIVFDKYFIDMYETIKDIAGLK